MGIRAPGGIGVSAAVAASEAAAPSRKNAVAEDAL
jgi:hypothetical protein